jgi:preprotein translocase subunit SecE
MKISKYENVEISFSHFIYKFSDFQNFKFVFMNKVTTYFKESYRELLEKVSWPTWSQLQQSTVIVLVATLVITGVVWAMDLVAQSGLKLIYSFFG